MTRRKLLYLIMAPIVAATLLLMSGVILAQGPGHSPDRASPSSQQGDNWPPPYRIAILHDPTTTNYWARLGPHSNAWNSILPGALSLLGYSAQRYDWIPVLAADFPSELTQGEAFWTSTVDLKQGVLWSDGTELTAEDVAFTANTALELGLGQNWEGVYGTAFLDHVEAVNKYTVKFFFMEKPGLAQWQFGAAMGPVLPKHYWEPIVAEAKTQPDPAAWLYDYVPENEPVAGPFMLSEWVPGSHVEVLPNPYYYFRGLQVKEYANGAYQEILPGVYAFSAYGVPTGAVDLSYTVGPHVGSVRYDLHTRDSAVQALRDGEVDFILASSGLERDTWESLASEPGVTTTSNPPNGFRYLAFNFRRSPMDVPAFRTAAATLIDREFPGTIVEENASPVWSVVPEGNTFWHNSTVPHIGEGLTRQERISDTVDLLTTAGFTWTVQPAWDPVNQQVIPGQGLHRDGIPVPDLELLAPNNDYDPLRATAALSTTQWLNEAGISVTAVLTDFGTIVNHAFGSHDFDMYMLGWGVGLYPDHLCSFFYSGADFNTPGYNNPAFDAKCDAFLAETDVDAAREDAYELQTVLATDLPYGMMFAPPVREAYRSDRIAFPYTDVLDGIQGAGGMEALVRACYDFNGDRQMNTEDATALIAHWRKRSTDPDWDSVKRFDLDRDGDIDIVDIALLTVGWGPCLY